MHQKVLSMILVLVMLLGLLSVSAFTTANTTSSDSAASNDDSFYRIVHLDCGRKYFTKDWIIALLNEMKADGYNQLQLAFGNDGLRFLLDNMSFEANGITYSHKTVVSKVEAGNEAQNSSGDKSWLKQSEMDDIISAAKALGIEIVPLLNLPGHANAILDIANDAYNASGSNNTLDVANSEAARSFGMAIFQKYVDYFASRGCKFFSFGADEYANDAEGTFSFSRLNSTQYSSFVSFINSLSTYVKSKGMTPRAFNDGLYYNGQSASIDTEIQCCYWSGGWSGYNVATPSAISGNGHAMINTHGDYYYVLGKADNFDSGYSYASSFDNTVFASKYDNKISNPVGSMFCIWCDYPNAETEQTVAQKVRLPMRAMALRMENQSIANMDESVVTNGFNANGSLNAGSTVTPDTSTSTKDIYVAVNGTATDTIDGEYPGMKLDDAVASVVGGEPTDKPGTTTYEPATLGEGTFYVSTTANDTAPTVQLTFENAGNEQYYIKNSGGKYLYPDGKYTKIPFFGGWWEYTLKTVDDNSKQPVTVVTSTEDKSIVISRTVTNNRETSTAYLTLNGTTFDADDNGTSLYLYSQKTTPSGKETTLTFTGKSAGTTTVTIGNVKYNITVTAEDLSKVTPLTIEYWITNSTLKGNDGKTQYTIQASDSGVASEAGVATAGLVAKDANKDGRTQEYWQTKLLDTTKKNSSTSGTEAQTGESGDDETQSGSTFTKVRYWGGAWQVFTTDWVTVKNTDQLVAYYMEVISITNNNGAENLHVNAADWGTKGDGTGNWGYTPESSRCSVSVQLVYEDGSTSPSGTTANELKSKTIVYGYWDGGRGLGTMVFNGKDNYQIFKVTAETGKMYSTAAAGNTVTVTNFTWQSNEETVWEGAATDSVSIGNPARNASYDPPYDNLAWNTTDHNHNNAILIRVYVKSIPKAGALTVNYFVQGNADPFYHYAINVAENTTFDAGFARKENPNAPGKAELVNNTVINYDGEKQTVQSDLSKMTEIGAQYRYSDYTFVSATRSDDGKTVNLYYTFKAEKTFVIDFGLPLEIHPTDVHPDLQGVTITKVDIANQSTYANINADANGVITYTLNQRINGADTFSVYYHGYRGTGSADKLQYTITVIPATSVYYEDSFATFTNGTGKAAAAKWTTDTDGTPAKATTTQALTELGKMSADAVYGYDNAYADSTKLSMGSAHKVTVKANMVDDWTDGSAWPSATFTFKGTGFDVISLTDNTSGAIFVDVYAGKEATGTPVKQLTVNNYYGYEQDGNGKWVVDTDSSNALYQIPVMKVSGLDYNEYTAVIRVAYSKFFDTANKNQYSFWLDAIRVYDPMGKDIDTYKQDNEGYPQYIKLRDQLAKENGSVTTNNNLLFIDGADKAAIATYANYGPNNEVYLANGQAITFNVPKNDKIASIQIGAKAPNGSAAKMVVTGDNGLNQELSTATEMYYEIGTVSGNFTIANKGDGILSLTNLKITYTASGESVSLAPLTTADQANAVAQVRALFAAPAEPFQPDRFEASWGHAVRKGDTATLTVKASEDVDSITVDGKTITAYATKTERTGWGWWAKTVTYREFTYQVAAEETTDYPICAVNSAGVSSDPIIATLTVRPSVHDWWHGIFDKWF